MRKYKNKIIALVIASAIVAGVTKLFAIRRALPTQA